MSQRERLPSAEQLRGELVRMDRQIRDMREALTALRARRAGLHARLSKVRAAERRAAAGFAPDENLDLGGEG